MELLVFRPLRTASPLAKLVASLGILLTLQAAMLLGFGTTSKADSEPLPDRQRDASPTCSIPVNRFWMAGIVIVHHARARGAVPLDPVRPGDAGGLRERDRGDAGRPLAEPALDGEHRAGRGRGRRHGDPRGADRSGRLDHVAALHRARPRGGAVRPLHVARDRLRRRAPDRSRPVAPVLRLDAVLVPDRRRQPAARHSGAADVRHHRDRALPARRQPADAGRAGREAAAGGAETGAVPSPERPVHRARRAAPDRAAVRLPPGADAVPDRDRGVPVARGHHRFRRPGLARPGGAGGRVRVRGVAPHREGRGRLPVGAARGLGRRDAAGSRSSASPPCACAA